MVASWQECAIGMCAISNKISYAQFLRINRWRWVNRTLFSSRMLFVRSWAYELCTMYRVAVIYSNARESAEEQETRTYVYLCVFGCVGIGDELYDHHIICAIIVALRLVCHSQSTSNVFVPTAYTHTRERERKKERVYSRKHQQCTTRTNVVFECEPRFMYITRS